MYDIKPLPSGVTLTSVPSTCCSAQSESFSLTLAGSHRMASAARAAVSVPPSNGDAADGLRLGRIGEANMRVEGQHHAFLQYQLHSRDPGWLERVDADAVGSVGNQTVGIVAVLVVDTIHGRQDLVGRHARLHCL